MKKLNVTFRTLFLGLIYYYISFADSSTINLKPIVEEYKLNDTAIYHPGRLAIDAYKYIDSSILTKLKILRNIPDQSVQNKLSDSVRMAKLGYSFKYKVIPEFNGIAFDIYFKNKLVSQNNFELSSVQIDTIFNSCLFKSLIHTPGINIYKTFFNRQVLNFDDLKNNNLSPKLLKGKPIYLIRNPSINKSDSLLYFSQPQFINGIIKEPKPKMNYEFNLFWGKEIIYRLKYPYDAFWHPFAEQFGYQILTMQNGWAFHVLDKVVVNGIDISDKNDFSESFDSWILNDRPFFFFKKENYYGMYYDNYCLPQKYDNIYHKGCCESSVINPRFYYGNAFSFFAVKGNSWYLVIVHF